MEVKGGSSCQMVGKGTAVMQLSVKNTCVVQLSCRKQHALAFKTTTSTFLNYSAHISEAWQGAGLANKCSNNNHELFH